MFNTFKKSLYFTKLNLLYEEGLRNGKIIPFDDNFYQKLNETYVSGIPVSIHIKHLRPTYGLGKCYDRSLYMFFCFEDALLVRGNLKDLELKHGKNHSGHGWIELDNYVYDPTHLMRFDKDLYYKMFYPTKVKKYSTKDYMKNNKELYEDIKNTTLDSFRTNGDKRIDLIVIIPILQGIANLPGNEEFKNDLEEYLESINYNEKEIYNELNNKIKTLSYLE